MSKFECLKCGFCCTHADRDFSERRYIPIFYDEIRHLNELAEKLDVQIEIIADLMYPDSLNKVYIITSYALTFPDTCGFFDKNKGCLIYEDRPLTCKSYPLSLWREDALRKMLKVETSCKFVEKNIDLTLNKDFNELKEFFPDEYGFARKILIKGKEILTKIVQLEKDEKINLGYLDGSINIVYDYSLANQEHPDWERIEINLIEID